MSILNRLPFMYRIIIICLVLGVTAYIFSNELILSDNFRTLMKFESILLILMGLILYLYLYLSGRTAFRIFPQHKDDIDFKEQTRTKDIDSRIKEIKNQISSISENRISLSNEEKEDIKNSLKEATLLTITNDIVANIENKYSDNIIDENKRKSINDSFLKTSSRLYEEIFSLKRKANINLIIGSITTVSAGIILLNMAINNTIGFNDIVQLLSHYIPKLSVIIFIEIFAFFFLKLYKNNLSEIKYYQNEMTNVESRFLSLQVALNKNNEECLTKVITEYSKTDRNFFDTRNSSTEDIEKSKIEKEKIEEIMKLLPKLVEKLK